MPITKSEEFCLGVFVCILHTYAILWWKIPKRQFLLHQKERKKRIHVKLKIDEQIKCKHEIASAE